MTTAALPEGYQLLDLPEAMRLAVEVIAEVGADHQYFGDDECVDADGYLDAGDCQYVTEDREPDCLVGRILHRHGVPIEILTLWEGYSAREMGHGYGRREVPTQSLVTSRAADILEVMQSRQDDNLAWGRVLEFGREAANRMLGVQ